MQSHDSGNQRPEEVNPDGRRNDERSAVQDAHGVAPALPVNAPNRAVHLSANLRGKGGAAG